VNFRPGVVQTVREGFNVRFDIYEGSMSDKYDDSNYRPAQNVRKAYVYPNTCPTRRGAHWQVNHRSDAGPSAMVDGGLSDNTDVPSRYRVYRYEIEQGLVGELGAPACYRGEDLSAVPDRRILHAAVINCQSLRSVDEPHSNVPVAAFGKFFLTLPLAPAQTDLHVEMVGLVRPGDGVSFDVVQLYR